MCLRVIRGSQLRTLVFLEPIKLPDKSTARQCPVIVSTFRRFFGSCFGFSGDRFSRSFVVNRLSRHGYSSSWCAAFVRILGVREFDRGCRIWGIPKIANLGILEFKHSRV